MCDDGQKAGGSVQFILPVIYSTPLLCFYHGGISRLTFNPLCERFSPELYNPVIIVEWGFHCTAVSYAWFYTRFTQETDVLAKIEAALKGRLNICLCITKD